MNVLVIGSGAREHCFIWKLSQSKKVSNIFSLQGNGGTHSLSKNLNVSTSNFPEIKNLVIENNIGLVLVGPEEPLVKGIVDYFSEEPELKKIPIIGPSCEGAKLEGSKDFAKKFMKKYKIPTANYNSFSKENISDAFNFLETISPPYVLKADGLAAGKGVVIIDDLITAKKTLLDMLDGNYVGDAGNIVVIEEYLKGIEVSMFVLTDGENYILLPEAKDYKRIGEGDIGLNTGGMGAVSPVSFVDEAFKQKVIEQIIKPTIFGLKKEHIAYKGFIFFGIMNVKGNPYVIEYNCRMGDPETEVVIPRIKNDLYELLMDTWNNNLKHTKLEIDHKSASTVVAVSGGYPKDYLKGHIISGFSEVKNSVVFHAGTKFENNAIVTNGGRVLAITSLADNLKDALDISYKNLDVLYFKDMYFRKDIGKDLLS